MSARETIRNALLVYYCDSPNPALVADTLMAHDRAEVLATDGQAYDGQLAMLTGLVATLRAVAKHGDLDDVRKLLAEHAADEAVARVNARETATADAPQATPFFQPGHTYAASDGWQFRCDTVTTHPEDGELTALGWRYFHGRWEPIAYHQDDWECHEAVGHTDVTGAGEGQ